MSFDVVLLEKRCFFLFDSRVLLGERVCAFQFALTDLLDMHLGLQSSLNQLPWGRQLSILTSSGPYVIGD